MTWNNPPIPWSELEKQLTEATRPGSTPPVGAGPGDSPAWSNYRAPYQPPPPQAPPDEELVDYAELHVHSSFSFLDGVSSPEALVAEASRLRLSALAITDHDGLYGIVRFAEAAQAHQMPTVFGAELSLAPEFTAPTWQTLPGRIFWSSPKARRAITGSPKLSPIHIWPREKKEKPPTTSTN